MILQNAKIYTFDQSNPFVNAMAIKDNKIVAVGDFEKISLEFSNEKTVDLKGKTVVPGFFDAHAHVWKIGDLLTFNLDLRDAKSIKEIQSLLLEFSKKNPDLKWIRARGFNEANLKEGRLPTREDIDEIISDKPVFLQRTCAHIATINSCALKLCNITNVTRIPFGGVIDFDNEGHPNGILRETALGLAMKHFPKFTEDDYEKMILAASNEFVKHGVTSVSDPAVMPDLLKVYIKLEKEGKLPIRIHAFPIVIPDGDSKALPIPDMYISEKLVINTVKFFADGGLSGQTAALSRKYKNADSTGILRLDKQVFFEAAKKAQKKGFQIATHAIGDVAIELVLDVYKELYKIDPKAPKHRIEHLGLPTMSQLDQIKEMGLHIVTQPIFLKELSKNFTQSLDNDYLDFCYPFKSMLERGINVSFSTDAPVVKDIRPLSCMETAVTRKDFDENMIAQKERIKKKEAFYCYTMGSALASRVDHKQGSITKGKSADFIILDRSPFDEGVDPLTDLKIEKVFCNGVQVF